MKKKENNVKIMCITIRIEKRKYMRLKNNIFSN